MGETGALVVLSIRVWVCGGKLGRRLKSDMNLGWCRDPREW
jgi:hypothetical protein